MAASDQGKDLARYAVIGDTRTTALVADDGSIDWWCPSRHDAPAVLTRLLDAQGGGAIALAGDWTPDGRRYEPDSNVLQTDLRSGTGERIRLTDFMALHPLTAAGPTGPDGDAPGLLLRTLEPLEGCGVRVELHVRLAPDYGRASAALQAEGGGVRATWSGGAVRVSASHPLAIEGDRVVLRLRLGGGERAFIACAADEAAPRPATLAEAEAHLDATRAYWRRWSGLIRYDGAYPEAVRRSALALKLLTHAPSGAIVAAATTSLPEAVPGERNYDYRYCWTRDASFTVTALCNLGLQREAAEFLRFLVDAGAGEPGGLRLLYGVDGPVPDETVLEHLPGWRGVGPVRIGNAASGQRQHDIHGELMIALHAFLQAVDFRPPAALAPHLAALVRTQVASALENRGEPDHGIWELRSEPIHALHSKALLWAALDRAAAIAERIGGVAEPGEIASWRAAAASLRAEYEARAWSEAKRAWVRDYDSEVLDAAVMRAALFGALDPRDPRMASTLEAVAADLGAGDLVYRYRAEDGLRGEEATFTACAFWRVGVLALADRTDEAASLLERLLARGGDLGLFAEEIDAGTGEQRGNLPQAFTHMAVINHALRVDEARARAAAGRPPGGGPAA